MLRTLQLKHENEHFFQTHIHFYNNMYVNQKLAMHPFIGRRSEEPLQCTVEKDLMKDLKADHTFKTKIQPIKLICNSRGT